MCFHLLSMLQGVLKAINVNKLTRCGVTFKFWVSQQGLCGVLCCAMLGCVLLLVLWAGLGWAGLGWAGLGWAGLGWAGLGWAGLGWAGLGAVCCVLCAVCCVLCCAVRCWAVVCSQPMLTQVGVQ
jgi:hypothetical protein